MQHFFGFCKLKWILVNKSRWYCAYCSPVIELELMLLCNICQQEILATVRETWLSKLIIDFNQFIAPVSDGAKGINFGLEAVNACGTTKFTDFFFTQKHS